MAMTTDYDNSQLDAFLQEFYNNEDEEIVNLLRDCRNRCPRIYIRTAYLEEGIFRKKTKKIYDVLIRTSVDTEMQILNLGDRSLRAINIFLLGFYNGFIDAVNKWCLID